MTMNAADIVILAVIALSMLFGLWRGLVSEVLSLVCWVAAFWVAWAFGDQVAMFYAPYLHQTTARIIAGYVTCFIGVLVVGALFGWSVHKLMAHGGLRGGDRFLGMLFGLARGLLLVTFAVLMLGFTAVPRQATWWQQSLLLPGFENAAGWIAGALPPDVTRHLEIGRQAAPVLSKTAASVVRTVAGQTGRRSVADPPVPAGSASPRPRAR